MSSTLLRAPVPPAFQLDWAALDEGFEWVRALRGCAQHPAHHAEGDAWTHTRLVLEALCGLEAFRALTSEARDLCFAAALLHDVAKPACTRQEDGRLTSRGHASRGENLARVLLWKLGVPLRVREHITALVRFHEVPFFLIDREDARRRLYHLSQRTSPALLALVAEADARGRECANRPRLLERVALFRELAAEEACLDRPRAFPSEHSRFEFFRRPDRDPTHLAHEAPRLTLTLLSGLPGSGKDRWLETHGHGLPAVSLDDVRRELRIGPGEDQGRVLSTARERARVHLRAGQDFVWNATNLSRQLRQGIIELGVSYHARTRIEYLEVEATRQRRQNRDRPHPVPTRAIEAMLRRWQVPDPVEADVVNWNSAAAGWWIDDLPRMAR